MQYFLTILQICQVSIGKISVGPRQAALGACKGEGSEWLLVLLCNSDLSISSLWAHCFYHCYSYNSFTFCILDSFPSYTTMQYLRQIVRLNLLRGLYCLNHILPIRNFTIFLMAKLFTQIQKLHPGINIVLGRCFYL